MKDCLWRAISVDCIDPVFPDVAVYLKSGGNFVLYKDAERKFTEDDRRRLENTLTEFLYVRSGDVDLINNYLENNLSATLAREDLSGVAKGRILYQASVNYVIDVFGSPETSANLDRCRSLVKNLMNYVATEKHALEPLQSISGHNFYIFAHSVQVAALNLLMHEQMYSLEQDELTDVGVGSLLHDMGMIFISDEILDKPDALSDVEYHKVKQHTEKGYESLKQTGFFSEIALTIVRHHHESYDGKGYPAGLKGDDIPRSAQLTHICDVYSALTTDRAFRKASPPINALKTMKEEAKGGFFNYEMFSQFEEIITGLNEVSSQERTHLLIQSKPVAKEIILRRSHHR